MMVFLLDPCVIIIFSLESILSSRKQTVSSTRKEHRLCNERWYLSLISTLRIKSVHSFLLIKLCRIKHALHMHKNRIDSYHFSKMRMLPAYLHGAAMKKKNFFLHNETTMNSRESGRSSECRVLKLNVRPSGVDLILHA